MLGVLQVGGGFAGLLAIANELGGDAARGGLGLALFAALLVFGMAAGVALLEGTRWGRRSSIVFWWLQLPVFSSPAIDVFGSEVHECSGKDGGAVSRSGSPTKRDNAYSASTANRFTARTYGGRAAAGIRYRRPSRP